MKVDAAGLVEGEAAPSEGRLRSTFSPSTSRPHGEEEVSRVGLLHSAFRREPDARRTARTVVAALDFLRRSDCRRRIPSKTMAERKVQGKEEKKKTDDGKNGGRLMR